MAFYTYAENTIGCFKERDVGNYFEYSANPDYDPETPQSFPHIVWVGGEGVCGMTGWRYAHVRKTVAEIAVDEDEFGCPVTEKWHLRRNDLY